MELLRVIDTLQSTHTQDPRVRAELDGSIAQAAERRTKLEEQLAMADEFLDLLRRQ